MSDVTTAMVDINEIAVEDGLNPRKRFDENALAELAQSIRQTGSLLTALTVCSADGGGYTLLAGERRLRAAKLADLQEVPVVVRPRDGALAAALAENLVRCDLDPIEEAEALARLAKTENLSTHKALAARVGKSGAWVSERLRLLQLPEAVQAHIACGTVPVAAERDLRSVAKVAPRVAECVCELAARGDIDGRDLTDRFGEVLHAAAQAKFDSPPTLIALTGSVRLSALVARDHERFDGLSARLRAIPDSYGYPAATDDPWLTVAEDHIDAARAAGCLIEHSTNDGDWQATRCFLVDRDFAIDLAERIVERSERAAAERAQRTTGAKTAASDDERQARRAEREKARAAAIEARGANLSLGRRMIGRRGAKSRREHALTRAKALGALLLATDDRLPAAGLRLVLPQLQRVEVKQLKSKETREKVIYAEPDECLAYLQAQIDRAKSANEVLELLADALIAVALVDPSELPRSRREYSSIRGLRAAIKLLAPDIRAIKPRARKATRS